MKKMFCRFLIDNSLRAASVSVRAIAVVPPVKSGRSTRMVIQQCLMLAALVGIGKVATAQTQVVTNWAAFNDHRPTVGVTHDNATGYDMRMTGNGGILKDFFTGADLPVQLVVENTGAVPDDFGANNYPADGSPAFNLFNGIVDVGNSGTPGIRNSAATILSLTFTNLDPAKKYLFRGTSVRGNNYPDRWAVYTIVSADAFTDAHALGDPNNPNNTGDPSNPNLITKTTFDTATLTNGQVALNSGENRLGSLVGWNDINPGPDGAFSVLAAQYIGLTPFGNPSAGPYGYGFTAIYLAETEIAGPVRITRSPTNVVVAAGVAVTFSVTAQSAQTISYQWQKAGAGSTNFANIAGATSASYTTSPTTTADDGTKFRCVASVAGGSAISREATLTVDTTPPTVGRARGSESFDRIFVIFSEPVTAASAGAMSNYSLAGGLTISNVSVVNTTTVRLLTSKQTEGASYTLTVNNVRDLVGNTITANSQATVSAFVFSRGFATWHRWQNQGGDTATIDTFITNLADPNFRDSDFLGTSTYLGSPRGVSDNYGVKAFGYFSPPQNGNYVFFMATDDEGYLYLSTDESPANRKRIAAQPQWSDQNQWLDPDAISTTEVRSDSYSLSEWTPPNAITLTSGRRYYIELDFREGTGGDGGEVYYKLDSAADPVNGTAPNTVGSVIGTFADPAAATITIAQQPESVTIPANTQTTFSIGVTANPTNTIVLYQWQKNGVDISGANAASYTTGFVTTNDHGARYRVVVTVAGKAPINSDEAVLNVFSDTAAPTVTSATANLAQGGLTVTVIFSEPVASATATALANYQIAPAGGGANLTLSSATLTNQTEVILTAPAPTNALAFVLTVNNVRDLAGNQIQTNTQTAVTLTTILIAIDDVTLWSYENAGMDLGTAWKERNYNDSAWPKGAALLALESGATAEAIRTQLSRQDANGVGIITDYFRTHFRFSGDPATAQLRIRHVVDDGVAIYLNGTEVHRFFLPVTGPITATTVAVPSDHENRYEGPFDIPSAALVTGDNVIAAEVHQNSATSSDVVFGLVLEAIVSATPSQPPTITNTSLTGGNISIQWNGGGTLESAPSLSGPWTSTNDSDGSFSEAATGAGKYYRVRR